MKPLKICIDARLITGEVGGVEQFIIGLASGLSQLTDGLEEYLFLVYPNSKDWLAPFLGGPCLMIEETELGQRVVSINRRERLVRRLIMMWNTIAPQPFCQPVPQQKSSGIIEKAGVGVMHFTLQQNAFVTHVPSIYHPHDLQHIHLPEFFSWRTRVARDQTYRAFCNESSMVAVASNFIKRDLIKHYQIPEEKVKVVTLAPVVTTYTEPSEQDLEALRFKYDLPERYIFYPAQTWPHKNHIGLLNALAILRDNKHLEVAAVFSGAKFKFYDTIQKKVEELGLEKQVCFLGFVSPKDLRGLYKLSHSVVIPTRFEAASFPLWESFIVGVPAACSNVTSLPEQANGSALIFDPDTPEDIADKVYKLWTDETLRQSLVERARINVSRFSWKRTAKLFRAHYRRLAQRPLSEEDINLLLAPSLF